MSQLRPQPNELTQLSSISAIGVGLGYLITGIAFLAQPAPLRGAPPEEFWLTLIQHPTAHLMVHWASAATGLCGLALVPAVASIFYRYRPGRILWSSTLAWLGFAVHARGHLMEAAFDRRIIPIYADAEPPLRQAVHVIAGLALDVPDGFLSFGAVGIWLLSIAQIAGKRRILPGWLAGLGLVTGAAFLLGVIGFTTVNIVLVTIAAGVGATLLAPTWFILLGIVLYRDLHA